jgi:hypothetical protein
MSCCREYCCPIAEKKCARAKYFDRGSIQFFAQEAAAR